MEMFDDLRKLKLPRDKNSKELLADMAAIWVQHKYNVTERKKAVVVLQAGREDYSVIVTMISSITKVSLKRSATTVELVVEMHKHYQIAGHKTSKQSKAKQRRRSR